MPRFDRNYTPTGKTHLDFPGIRDEKRRVVGMHIYRGFTEYVEPVGEKTKYWCGYERDAAGKMFTAQTHATRNGLDYGASNRAMEFATEAEREAWINKSISATRNRYLKKYNGSI